MYYMPAEWAAQQAVWLSWPLNDKTWPQSRDRVEDAFAHFAAVISRFQNCCILCIKPEQKRILNRLQSAGACIEQIQLYDIATNDAWCRDHGPTFVCNKNDGSLAVVDWKYNAWGGKFSPWDLDAQAAQRIANALNIPCIDTALTGEGGALEVNDQGVLLTTRSVWLNPNRNPGWTEQQVEEQLKKLLGLQAICWLDAGLVGDDTDGHIDTLTRFFKTNGVLTATAPTNSPNHAPLQKNLEQLQRFTLPDGNQLEIVELPLPDPIHPDNWREDVLPATYANFLLINGAVLMPAYGQPANDEQAMTIIASCFPNREAIPIDCSDIILEGGALHCLSQQQPC